jgi:mono/diheme cytochrome c family protein
MSFMRFSPFQRTRKSLFIIAIATICGVANPSRLHWAYAAEAPAAPTSVARATKAPLSPDDVSWLFPVPKNARDLSNFIAIGDLTAPDPNDPSKREPVWPLAAFEQFIANANGPSTQIGPSHHLKLPPEASDIKVWHVAGLRIDPGAPGLTPEIIAQYGQQPQVRLILQPVTTLPNGQVKVHDVAAHLIYTYITGFDAAAEPGCIPRPIPDLDAFRKIAGDFATLRDELQDGQFGKVRVETAGRLLGVHPGLANPATAKPLRDELVTVLQRHLSGARISGMAVMGLADGGPEPWVFLAMSPVGPGVVPALPNGGFVPVPGPALDGAQFAQALAVLERPHQVIPTPAPNNLNPITCKNPASPAGAAALPVAERKGLATAELFDLGDQKLVNPQDVAKVEQTVDVIADASRSHFFNTDCISCHTDTRRALDLLQVKDIAGVDPSVLPKEKWNVRNFGWFPSFLRNTLEPTATRRAAAETAAVVTFINNNGLAQP